METDGKGETGAGPPSVEDVREDLFEVDLGNLMAYDMRALSASNFQSPEAADGMCMELGRVVMQALASRLFGLPSTPEKIGRSIRLPPPSTPLPREKPLPAPRPPTKWEKFAEAKGITKRKRSKLEFDEGAQEWRRRWGYKRAADERDQLVVEARPGEEPGSDPFATRRAEKKARVSKQESNRVQNLKIAAKAGGKAALPSTVQLAAAALPITAERSQVARPQKDTIGHVASLASSATASIGKFDTKRPNEKPLKHTGKHRKFLPVVEGSGKEKQQMQSIMNKVLAKNDYDIDINKAVSAYNRSEEDRRSGGKDKTVKGGKGGKGGRGGKGGKSKGGAVGGAPGKGSKGVKKTKGKR